MRPLLFILLAAALLAPPATAQQVADPKADLSVARPAFPPGAGPRLVIDGGHHNFHTVDGRYAPFAAVARNDGFVVSGSLGRITAESLSGVKVLVVANALHPSNDGGKWTLPNPSAFAPEEITAVKAWVEAGGGLLLIADHMPFAGAAQDLAQAFGFSFSNGFVQRAEPGGPDIFTPSNGLRPDAVAAGRGGAEAVESVRTFTGSAFTAPPAARPLIVLPRGYVSKEPRVAWEFERDTRVIGAEGWLQGAVMPYDQGRIAVFGEGAMFTAQLGGPKQVPIGFNAPDARDNRQLLLNVVRWLAGVLPAA